MRAVRKGKTKCDHKYPDNHIVNVDAGGQRFVVVFQWCWRCGASRVRDGLRWDRRVYWKVPGVKR